MIIIIFIYNPQCNWYCGFLIISIFYLLIELNFGGINMYLLFDSIIFDLDGTIFQTDKLAIPAFENTFRQLEDEGYVLDYEPTHDELLSVIGMTLDDIWANLIPGQNEEVYQKASRYLLEYELNGIKDGYGALFPKVVETLIDLKSLGFRLFIASNGLKDYVDGVLSNFRINHLFEAIYSAGEYKTETKKELVNKIINDFEIKKAVMVGDRSSDIEAGKANNLFIVGCDFGFSSNGELKGADKIITSFGQLVDLVRNESFYSIRGDSNGELVDN